MPTLTRSNSLRFWVPHVSLRSASSVRMDPAGPAAEVFARVPGQFLPLLHVVVRVRVASNPHRIVPFIARIGRGRCDLRPLLWLRRLAVVPRDRGPLEDEAAMEFQGDLDVLGLCDLHRDDVEHCVAAEYAVELVPLLRWRVEVVHHLAFVFTRI